MSGWDEMFSKEWAGLEYKCLSWRKEHGRNRCTNVIDAFPPLQLANLEGNTICGRRGGKPFVDTVRPNRNGECP